MGEAKQRDLIERELAKLSGHIDTEYAAANDCLVAANKKMAEAVAHAIACGGYLAQAKLICPKKQWGSWQEANLKFSQETASLYVRFYEHHELISNAVTNSNEVLSLRDLRELLPKGKARGKAGGRAAADPVSNGVTNDEEADDDGADTTISAGGQAQPKPQPKPKGIIEQDLLAKAISIVDMMTSIETIQALAVHMSAATQKLMHREAA